MAYVGGNAPARSCIFCRPAEGDARERLLLGATRHAVVLLNRYPYASGHLLVAPRVHTCDLAALSVEAHAGLAEALRAAEATLRRELQPQGMNLGMNLGECAGAGIVDHLHWHVVPRWAGDTNFMATVADARVVPQHLLDTYDRLRGAFAWLDGTG